MQILIFSHSKDNHATQTVIDKLKMKGAEGIRFDTDHYPTDICVSSRLENNVWFKQIRSGKTKLNLNEINAIWYRRWYTGYNIPRQLGNRRPHCIDESVRTLYGTIASMPVYQLDRWVKIRAADFKELQAHRAAEAGLSQPATLFSNDPEEVKEFVLASPNGAITKMQSMFAIYEEGQEKVIFTNEINDKHLKKLDGLKYSPMLFQHKITNQADIRSTVIGDKVLSAILYKNDRQYKGIDWRAKGNQLVDNWQPYQLPQDIETKLISLVKSYQLGYAACDFVLDENGIHQFLEINACGEWCWIAESTKLPFAETLADHLITMAENKNHP